MARPAAVSQLLQQQQEVSATPPSHTSSRKVKPLVKFLLIAIFGFLFYIIGSYSSITTAIIIASTSSSSDSPPNNLFLFSSISNSTISMPQLKDATFNYYHTLDFNARHYFSKPIGSTETTTSSSQTGLFPICPKNFTNYCPCQDIAREKLFSRRRSHYRERHCPPNHEKLRCLVPRSKRYRRTFPWPKSKDMAWFFNVPFKKLTILKEKQNWVRLDGNLFMFPGGGTSFPKGVKGYVEQINKILDLKSGSIRTALDIGCGVASFGAALLDYNILTMSVAPIDIHEAQVQFALERGLPAMLGILGTYRLPYPSTSFDMAHCSRCLVQWTDYGGLYLLEIDRVLRPGGYWVLSGPPINWKVRYKGWQRQAKDLKREQIDLEDLIRRLCWKKIAERDDIAVWRKPTNHVHCAHKLKTWKSLQLCDENHDPDAGWYRKMDHCITPLPRVLDVKDTAGGTVERWPKRLDAVPPGVKRAAGGTAITKRIFEKDTKLWKRRVLHYGKVLKSLFKGRYRNVMDMNAGLGGFAAALSAYPVWVMNVVPYDMENKTLPLIYERGLIGTYMDWCEAFSTYPRTYDLIHADSLFSIYKDKCDIVDIVFEMYRILRPEGAIIIRDHVDTIVKVKDITERMGWSGKLSHSEHGPLHPEKILFIDNAP